jgi:hypothetical protein
MPELTRRRDHDRREESWLIYYCDVHVGTIAIRSGIPHDYLHCFAFLRSSIVCTFPESWARDRAPLWQRDSPSDRRLIGASGHLLNFSRRLRLRS